MTWHHMTWHLATHHITSPHVTSQPTTLLHLTPQPTASKQVTTSPPWNGWRLLHSKNSVWASQWLVTLCTFYRQILTLAYSFFFETSAPGLPGPTCILEFKSPGNCHLMVSKQGTTKPLCLRSVLLPEVRSCHLAISFGIQNLAFRKCFPWIYRRGSKEFYKTCGFQTNTLEMYYNHLQLIQIVFRQASNATNLEVLLILRVYLLCLHRCWGFQNVSDLFPASFGEDLRCWLIFFKWGNIWNHPSTLFNV